MPMYRSWRRRDLRATPGLDGCCGCTEQLVGRGGVAVLAERASRRMICRLGASLPPMNTRSIADITGSGIVIRRLSGATIWR